MAISELGSSKQRQSTIALSSAWIVGFGVVLLSIFLDGGTTMHEQLESARTWSGIYQAAALFCLVANVLAMYWNRSARRASSLSAKKQSFAPTILGFIGVFGALLLGFLSFVLLLPFV